MKKPNKKLSFLPRRLTPIAVAVMLGFGFMAAANVALNMHAKPIFCDVDYDSWCMSGVNLESCITPKTKAIVPIHTYGNVCDMDVILEIANRYHIPVIEDAAEAIGSEYKGKVAGTLGKLGTYSFHATKTITTGEGGAVSPTRFPRREPQDFPTGRDGDRQLLARDHAPQGRRLQQFQILVSPCRPASGVRGAGQRF